MRLGYELISVEFHQLRYFVAVAETLSVTKAAEKLFVSQPALSRQIAKLEDELGVALFDRVRKRMRLTPAGRFFLPKARAILCDAETAVEQLRERYGAARTAVRLGFIAPFLDDLVTPAAKRYRHRVALHELTPRAQLDRLRDGELDVAILGNITPEDRKRYDVVRLVKARLAVAVASDHELASRKSIDFADLAPYGFVSLSDRAFPGRRAFLQSLAASKGFDPWILEETESLSGVLGAVAASESVALIPWHARKLPHQGAVFVPLKGRAIFAEVSRVSHRDETRSSVLDFLAALDAVASEMGSV